MPQQDDEGDQLLLPLTPSSLEMFGKREVLEFDLIYVPDFIGNLMVHGCVECYERMSIEAGIITCTGASEKCESKKLYRLGLRN